MNVNLSLRHIASALNLDAPDMHITSVTTDSRSVVEPQTTLFVALTTKAGNGHKFIPELHKQGVKAFLVETGYDEFSLLYPDAIFLSVDNTLNALQTIASECRKALSSTAKVVAITGSRGKTVVKELIYSQINAQAKASRSPRSFNSQIGVALSLIQTPSDTEIALIEAGISTEGEMCRLREMISPNIGVITCITDEHAHGFSSREKQIAEKISLFKNCDTIIYNADDPEISASITATYPHTHLVAVKAGYPHASAKLIAEAVVETLGLNPTVSQPPEVETRLDIIEGVNSCKLILDRFTPDIQSLEGALDFLHRRSPADLSPTLIVSSADFENYPSELDRLLNLYSIRRLVTIGAAIEHSFTAACSIENFASPSQLSANDFSDEIILIDDSPTTPLSDIYAMLEAKQHETVLEVNLDAVVHNFNFFRSKVKPSTGIICMLKAAGYGAGSVELARTLQAHGAAYIAVAVVDEGVELRRAGITMPIMVLNPRAQNMKMMFDYALEPEVYSFELLDQIISAAQRYGITDFPIHLKTETGMSRLGFLPEEMEALGAILVKTEAVRATSIFSHLACADDPVDDDYTHRQFQLFNQAYDTLCSVLPYRPLRHILNSTGIVRFPEHQYDMVRLGIGLYGIPTLMDGSMDALQNVSTLSSVIISLKHWPAGRTIGYNRRTVLKRDSIIATIPIGYADGIDRHLGNGNGYVMINGQKAPIAGNVCMDILMADITDIVLSGHEVKTGDRVEIFGSNLTPMEIAASLGTIPYEILTSVSPRVKRVYYRE